MGASGALRRATAADIISRFAFRKNSSRPSRDHTGEVPPVRVRGGRGCRLHRVAGSHGADTMTTTRVARRAWIGQVSANGVTLRMDADGRWAKVMADSACLAGEEMLAEVTLGPGRRSSHVARGPVSRARARVAPRRAAQRQRVDIVRLTDVAQHDGGIAFQPAQLGPLHRRLPEHRTEAFVVLCQKVSRQCPRILPRDELPRCERRVVRQRLRKLHVPRTHLLGDVSV